MARPSDFELLDAWRDGDRRAGDRLLRRHFDSVYCFFNNKVKDGVDDLIQRTFLQLCRARDQFRKQSSFRTYLFTVARHELYRHFRQLRRARGELDLDRVSVAELGTSPSRVMAKKAEQKLLLQALREIPVDLQIAVELHYWEGMSTQEIAEILEIPRGTAKSRLRRAREALEAAMHRLARSPADMKSTMANFDRWAKSVRGCVGPSDDG